MESPNARITRAIRIMHDRYSFRVSGELRLLVLTALWEYVDRREAAPLFTVDEWNNGSRVRIVASCNERVVAQAAFEAATVQWPEATLTMRHGARVIKQWPAREC